MLENVMRQLRMFEELVRARMQVDVAGMVAGVRARLESRLALEALPVDADLSDKRGPAGWGRIATTAWQAPGFRKIVLSHIDMPPLLDGFAVVVLPLPKKAAPVFAADLMALPTRVSVNADLYASPSLQELARQALEPLGESFARLESGGGPSWAQAIASGRGLHAKLTPRAVEDAFAGVSGALAQALEVAGNAPEQGEAGAQSQKIFFELFHTHGPRIGPLATVMGSTWAERYSRLIFE